MPLEKHQEWFPFKNFACVCLAPYESGQWSRSIKECLLKYVHETDHHVTNVHSHCKGNYNHSLCNDYKLEFGENTYCGDAKCLFDQMKTLK